MTEVENSTGAAAAISAVEALDIAATWIGEPGRSALSGLAIVTEPESAEVTWIPAICSTMSTFTRHSPPTPMYAVTESSR